MKTLTKTHLIVVAVTTAAVMLTLGLGRLSVLAQGGDEDIPSADVFNGLDLVFLIDQSGSMSGEHTGANDPNSQRIYAVHVVIEYLGIDNLHYLSQSTHRIGVVSFGDEARIALPLTPFKTQSEEELAKAVMEQRAANMTEQVRPDQMGNTHFITAFEKARQVFDEAPELPGPRTKAIILLTDGQPALEQDVIVAEYGYPFFANYFTALKSYVGSNFPLAPEALSTEGYHIWVVAMNDWDEDYWLDNEKYWQDIVGSDRTKKLSQNREDVPGTFSTILDMIFDSCPLQPVGERKPGDRSPCFLEEGEFAVPPYLDKVVFYVFKSRTEGIVTFYQADGSALSRDDPSVVEWKQIGELNESITVDRPAAGMWRWEKDPESRATVRFQPLLGVMEIHPLRPHVLQEGEVIYNIKGRDQTYIPIDPNYPLKLDVTLTWPDNLTSTVPMSSGTDGAKSVEPVLFLQPGSHHLSLKGSVYDALNRELRMFGSEYDFEVTDIRPRQVSPDSTQLQLPFHETEVVYSLTAVDTGRAITVEQSIPFYMEWTLTSEAGDSVTQSTQSRGDSEYAAPLYFGNEGQYTLQVRGVLKQPLGEEIELFSGFETYLSADCVQAEQRQPIDEVAQNMPVAVAYDVATCGGRTFSPDPSHPLSVRGVVQKPSGTGMDLAFVWDDQTESYVVEVPAQEADEVGDYQIAVVAVGEDMDGDQVEAFRTDGSFTTYKTTPVKLSIVQPQPSARLPIRTSARIPLVPNTGQPTEVVLAVEVTDGQGNPVDPTLITDRSLGELLSFQLSDAMGNDFSSDLVFEKAPISPNRLKAASDNLAEEGEYTFEARLDGLLLRKEYVPIQGQTEDRVSFIRYDPTMATTRIIAGVEIVAALALIAAIALWIWSRTNTVRGELVFITGADSVSVPLARQRRRVVKIGPKDFGHPDLSKVEVQRAPPSDEEVEEVLLSAWDGEGMEITKDERIMDGDSSISLVGDVYIQYRHG